mgnify:CR=1 FL=1
MINLDMLYKKLGIKQLKYQPRFEYHEKLLRIINHDMIGCEDFYLRYYREYCESALK